MTRSVTVYGFGSAFGETAAANDLDLLIVHQGADCASCQLAIECKQRLSDRFARAHVTMLSDSEEKHFQFVKTAHAVYLGIVREDYIDSDVVALGAAYPQLATL